MSTRIIDIALQISSLGVPVGYNLGDSQVPSHLETLKSRGSVCVLR